MTHATDYQSRRLAVYFASTEDRSRFLVAARDAAERAGVTTHAGYGSWFIRKLWDEWKRANETEGGER